jgi:hypothetical protein
MRRTRFRKFFEERKKGLAGEPKVKLVADDIVGEPNKKSPKEVKLEKGKHPQVKEYLDQNKKLIDKPPTELVPDVKWTPPAAPDTPKTKGKNWNSGAKQGKPAPYKAPGKDPGLQSAKDGLGDMGSIPKEKTEPKQGDSKMVPGGKTVSDWASKTKTEGFLRKTRGMSPQQLAEYILSENNGYRNLATDVHTNGQIKDLLEAILVYPESYSALADLLSDASTSYHLVRAMNKQLIEGVAPPIGIDEPQGVIGDEEMMGDDDEMDDEDMEDDDMEDEEMDFDDEEMDDEDELELDDEEMEDEDELELDDEEMEDDEQSMPYAFDHLIHAISKYPALKEALKKAL